MINSVSKYQRVKTYFLFHLQKYKELEKSVRVEEIDGMKVVKNLSKKMEEMFRKKKEAIRVQISSYLSFCLPFIRLWFLEVGLI